MNNINIVIGASLFILITVQSLLLGRDIHKLEKKLDKLLEGRSDEADH